MILDPLFYQRDTVEVAKDLVGKKIIRTINGINLSGIITETEAYGFSDDPASHAYRGKTQRNAPMFGPVGYAYVYFIYGNHFCFNIVARAENQIAGAVLIRAIQPIEGIELMSYYRQQKDIRILTNGPGKLTQALHITKQHNYMNVMQKGELYVTAGVIPDTICATPRIGISVGQDKLWRFII
ncbi:MAG TPA: DNA-3-methyladenine glycosylase [Candidatus Dependentiae bacterium]|nr:DNA-3-methyladenine glycosylase [Candidatus Dependentiae bacterium]HRQ62654.1 DNA-3-methyladenine glycosylase [Candidatus Dependentiae bacterium]